MRGRCGVAWWLAADVFEHRLPFFAPIAAVVSLGMSYGQRQRRVAEVTVGVALGVMLGDVATHLIGTGGWQIALIVAAGMSIALLLDAGQLLIIQAAVQGIVVAALAPAPGDAFLRWTDALIGGAVALVAATVVPRAPLRKPRDQAAVVVRKIADLLRGAADRLGDGDVDLALAALRDARSTDVLIAELRAASEEGLSVVSSSPFRRRHGEHQRQLADLVEPLDVALRNTRVVVRRVAVATYRREPVPASYGSLMRDLAVLSDRVADELVSDRMATAVIEDLIALGHATAAVEHSDDLSAEVILAQVRSIIADLLALCGMDPLEATDVIPLRSDLADHDVELGAPRVGSPTSTFQPSRVSASASACGVRGSAPSSSSARTIRPLVALLKWLTTLRRPADSWRTRTVATRGASSSGGRQKAAYVLDRRSTSSPRPIASRPPGRGPRARCRRRSRVRAGRRRRRAGRPGSGRRGGRARRGRW